MTTIQTVQIENCALCHAPGQSAYVGLKDRLHGVPGEWEYLLCRECDLLWLRNRPESDCISSLYSSYYTHKAPELSALSTARSLQRSIRKSVVRSGLVDILSAPTYWRDIWYGDQEHARFLDVGCGNGQFAAIMQRMGWDVYGIEPDEQAAVIAKEFLNAPIHIGNLNTAEYADGEFDLIRLAHVFEHLDDPLRALAKCYRLLKPGGRLIITTPNLASLGHRHRYGVYWLHLDPPRHFYLFSPKSLHRAAKAVGFAEPKVSTSARGAWLTWMTSATIARFGKLSSQWREETNFSQKAEASLVAATETILSRFIPLGEDLQLIAIR